jgi:4-amino-4-deoxy-L-arabinose transferase-like glycosyltransferase
VNDSVTSTIPQSERRWRTILLALALSHLVLALGVVLARIGYRFELEWMEGAMVDHVARLLEGQKLYVRPTMDFVSYNYPPLYYWLSGALARLMGLGFLPLRLVSLLGTLGCLALLYVWAKRETGDRLAGVLSMGLFAATFKVGGAWFDVARVDMLALFLLLAAFWVLRQGKGVRSGLAGGALVTLAFLTKQVMLAAALPLMLLLAMTRRSQAAGLWGTVIVAGGLATWLLDRANDGWYLYYVFDLPRRLPPSWPAAADFWVKDVLGTTAIATLVAALYPLLRWRGDSAGRVRFDLAAVAGLVAVSWASRLPIGGFNNVLLPAYLGLALLFGPGVHAALQWVRGAPPRYAEPLARGLCALCALQLVWLAYNPVSQVPRPRDAAAGRWLLERIAQVQGEVLMPYHGYLPRLAGKRTYAHWMSVSDVVRWDARGQGARLEQEIREAMRAHRFTVVILDTSKWLEDLVTEGYREVGPVFDLERKDDFWTVTGLKTRPQLLFGPKPPAGPPD